MKRKSFTLSIEGALGRGKEKPPALPQLSADKQDSLMAVLLSLKEKVKMLEAAASAAATNYNDIPAGYTEVLTASDAALVKAFLSKSMDSLLANFFQRHPLFKVAFENARLDDNGLYRDQSSLLRQKFPSKIIEAVEGSDGSAS